MKKIFQCVSFIMMICVFMLSATATQGEDIYHYTNPNVTIQFSSSSVYSSEKMQAVADRIVYGSPFVQSRSLCWLVGHESTTETVTAIYHKENDFEPRCRMDVIHVTTCANCDYYEEEVFSSGYISCCPED